MKKTTCILCVFCTLLALSGCSGDAEPKESGSSAADSQTTSAEKKDETSTAETTTLTTSDTQSSTDETTTIPALQETESPLLHLNQRHLYQAEWSEEYDVAMAELECLTVHLDETDAGQYPALAETLSGVADMMEVNMLETYDMLLESAGETLSSGAKNFHMYVTSLDAQVRRADKVVLSVRNESYQYDEYSEGITRIWGGTYDTETGTELFLPDIVTDLDAFAKAVKEELSLRVGADVFYSENSIENYFRDYGADGTNWTLEYNGMTVYFDAGDIATLDNGAMEVFIGFAEYPQLFKKKYTTVPESYIVRLSLETPLFTDLDGDGTDDELIVWDSYENDNNVDATLHISNPETYYSERISAYGCVPYCVKTADGKHYVYLFAEQGTQLYLYVYAVTNETISKVGEANLSPYYKDGISAILTDPARMHFDVFGDGAGGGVPQRNDFFAVGEDGMPK